MAEVVIETGRNTALPPTWCVIECENGCRETWAVNTAEFTPALTIATAEALFRPIVTAHRCPPPGADERRGTA